MKHDYLERILTARVYDVAHETPLEAAANLSARLGEGVLNGLLTARVGLSAMAVCRPMPFTAKAAPGVNDVAPFLFTAGKKD